MSTGDDIYRKVQAWARSEAAKTGRPTPTAEYLTRHMLESFLDRLTRTRHARDFAWRRKEGLEDISEASLDGQMEMVSGFLDPVFSNGE